MAEGLLVSELRSRGWQRRVKVDSAGTHAALVPRPADLRARRIMLREGVDIRKCRSRQVQPADFEKFTYILAMDMKNCDWLVNSAGTSSSAQVSLINSWSPTTIEAEIPDPYFGNLAGFETVLSMLRQSIHGFLARIDDNEAFR